MSYVIPAIIARDPIGLLGFLDTKTGGNRPQQLAEFVQPTLELRDWYAAGQAKYANGVTAALVAGQNALSNSSPPVAKGWWITRLWALANNTAVDWAAYGIGLQNNAGGTTVLLAAGTSGRNGIIGTTTPDTCVVAWSGFAFLRDEGAIVVQGFNVAGAAVPPVNVLWEYVEVDL